MSIQYDYNQWAKQTCYISENAFKTLPWPFTCLVLTYRNGGYCLHLASPEIRSEFRDLKLYPSNSVTSQTNSDTCINHSIRYLIKAPFDEPYTLLMDISKDTALPIGFNNITSFIKKYAINLNSYIAFLLYQDVETDQSGIISHQLTHIGITTAVILSKLIDKNNGTLTESILLDMHTVFPFFIQPTRSNPIEVGLKYTKHCADFEIEIPSDLNLSRVKLLHVNELKAKYSMGITVIPKIPANISDYATTLQTFAKGSI